MHHVPIFQAPSLEPRICVCLGSAKVALAVGIFLGGEGVGEGRTGERVASLCDSAC